MRTILKKSEVQWNSWESHAFAKKLQMLRNRWCCPFWIYFLKRKDLNFVLDLLLKFCVAYCPGKFILVGKRKKGVFVMATNAKRMQNGGFRLFKYRTTSFFVVFLVKRTPSTSTIRHKGRTPALKPADSSLISTIYTFSPPSAVSIWKFKGSSSKLMSHS